MSYTDEELDALNDSLNFTTVQKVSDDDLKYSGNDMTFESIQNEIFAGEKLNVKFSIDNGVPQYEVAIPNMNSIILYLNKEIIKYMLDWMVKGEIGRNPQSYDPQRSAASGYMYHLIRYDNNNNALHFDAQTRECKAVYPNGTIDYGVLSFNTREELIAKLNSLP